MTSATPTGRIGWLDAAKGIGIVLVVIGHALGGIIDSPLRLGQSGFRTLFFAIYSFHMPLFFLLSGLLVMQRLERGSGRFIKGLIPTIVWPYFLWSVIQYSVIYLLGSLVNRPAETYWPTILSLPWNTVSQFWFLYALFWLHMLAALLVRRVGGEAFVFLALAMKALIIVIAVPVAVKLVGNHAFFYAVGVFLGVAGVERVVLRHGTMIRALALPGIAVLVIVLTILAAGRIAPEVDFVTAGSPTIAHLAWRFPMLAAALFGVAAVLGIAGLHAVAASGLLAYLGRMTMPIFVLHVLFIAGSRIVLTRLGLVEDPKVLLVIALTAGLVGPLVVERLTRRLGLNRLLGFG